MPFGDYKSLSEALVALQVTETEEEFVQSQQVPVSDYFRSELELTLREFAVTCSEAAICETMIFPVLREAMKPFTDVLGLWSHVSLYHGPEFLGVPDYVIGKRSPLSRQIMEMPLALILEAKKNDFDAGWGQCVAAMHAVQRINGEPRRIVYGCVTDGLRWEFGKLQDQVFGRHPTFFQLRHLDELLGGWHHVLELCKRQVLSPAEAA